MKKNVILFFLYAQSALICMEEKNENSADQTLIWQKNEKDFHQLEKIKDDKLTAIDASSSIITRIDPAVFYHVSKNCPNVKTFFIPSTIQNVPDLTEYIYTHNLNIELQPKAEPYCYKLRKPKHAMKQWEFRTSSDSHSSSSDDES